MKNSQNTINKKVKQLRKQRAWSQSHLAEASGLSTRTVQRLERTGNCSDETLLCIAAAFDIDVEQLTSESQETPVSNDVQFDYLWFKFTPKLSFKVGLFLIIPGVLFVLSNVLKYEMNLPWLYDSLVSIGEWSGLNFLSGVFTSPFFLLGSLSIALILGVFSQLQVKGNRTGKDFTILGIQFSFHFPNSLLLLASVAAISILIGYATVENTADWIFMILNQ